MQRIKPRPISCSQEAWRELLRCINSLPVRVVVSRAMLEEVLQCNENRCGSRPKLDAEQQGWKYVVVNREALFAFVQEHGAICEGAGHGR